MQLDGTARGQNPNEIRADAKAQAKQFFGPLPHTITYGPVLPYYDYLYPSTPTITHYEADYTAKEHQ